MKAIVDANACVGCGLCADTCADVFEMKDNVAVVKGAAVPAAAEKACREAVEACPVAAITIGA